MNGDIISDLTSGLVGGLGIAPSANLGHNCAIFEAVHGSAPDIAGQNKANPLALLLSSVMLLRHLGEGACAHRVEQAIYRTLAEAKALPVDIAKGRPVASTDAFCDAIIEQLSQAGPDTNTMESYEPFQLPARQNAVTIQRDTKRALVGVDVFIEFDGSAQALGECLEKIVDNTDLQLKMISNRGTLVYPATGADTDCVNHWRCRFITREASVEPEPRAFLKPLEAIQQAGIEWMHLEKLKRFNDEDAFSKAQGES